MSDLSCRQTGISAPLNQSIVLLLLCGTLCCLSYRLLTFSKQESSLINISLRNTDCYCSGTPTRVQIHPLGMTVLTRREESSIEIPLRGRHHDFAALAEVLRSIKGPDDVDLELLVDDGQSLSQALRAADGAKSIGYWVAVRTPEFPILRWGFCCC